MEVVADEKTSCCCTGPKAFSGVHSGSRQNCQYILKAATVGEGDGEGVGQAGGGVGVAGGGVGEAGGGEIGGVGEAVTAAKQAVTSGVMVNAQLPLACSSQVA